MKITVDPNTDASGFGYANPGQHQLRVAGCEYKEAKATDKFPGLSWKFEFVDPNTLAAEEGKKVGNIFEYTTLKSGDNAQFRLRQFCDAVGVEWGELETEAFVGLEFEAQVGLDEYQGNMKNVVKKFIPAG